jgi:hypothetical protein
LSAAEEEDAFKKALADAAMIEMKESMVTLSPERARREGEREYAQRNARIRTAEAAGGCWRGRCATWHR